MATKSLRAQHVEATRAALLKAARKLFSAKGYAGVSTEEIVRQARVTRGALYHHFRDKRDLFRAVSDQVGQEMRDRLERVAAAHGDPWEALLAGLDAFLDGCLERDIYRVVILDGPAVLGWEEWRAHDERHALGLLVGGLQALLAAGLIAPQPVEPLAHLLLASANEAAMMIARSDDRARTREEIGASLRRLLEGLRTDGAGGTKGRSRARDA